MSQAVAEESQVTEPQVEPQETSVEETDEFPTDFSVEIPDPPGAETAATTEASSEQEATAADEFDATTLENASRLGLSAEVAKSFGSKEALQQALDATQLALDTQAAAWARAQLSQEAADDAQGGAPSQQQDQQQAAQAALEKLKIDLDPAEWDEQQIATFNKLNDHYHSIAEKHAAENKQLRDDLAVVARELVALRQSPAQLTGQQAEDPVQLTRDIDTFVANLGEEYRDIYGTGDKTPDPRSLHFAARAKLAEEMAYLRIADDQANRPKASNAELAQRALRLLHPDKIQTAARKEIAAKLEQRAKHNIARPSGHNGKAPSGDSKATSFVTQFLRDNAIPEAELESAI